MVKLALLWHMHQPWYLSPFTGKFELPWVRIHAVRDYYGMAKLVSEFPEIGVTFNLVPSLLKQIELYCEGKKDRFREIFEVPSSDLTGDETRFLVNNFFSVNAKHHIEPYPRYDYLYKKREENGGRDFTGDWKSIFSTEELTDIQVWFGLTNIDREYKDKDERVKYLLKKGEGFGEEDKRLLEQVEEEIIKKIIPLYRKLWKEGKIEISTTPFYHPILPLMIDPSLGRVADPSLPEYDLDFNWKEDAQEQVRSGLDYMEQLFGKRPCGIWPSEGSLSGEVIKILEDNGVKWTATDEKVLDRSLESTGVSVEDRVDAKFKPWIFNNGKVKIFFRDTWLSDLIGFHYKEWEGEDAAVDLFDKILKKGEGKNGDIILPVILDGENAWEFFEGSGRKFLRKFYSLVSESDKVDMITFSEAKESESSDLEIFSPGSWINGNFNIWIGDEDDRRGWGLIKVVKELIEKNGKDISAEDKSAIKENIMIAQGSDWFWWYGTENHTDDLETFDRLFRENLIKVCVTAGVEIPSALETPVYGIKSKKKLIKKMPDRYITPVIDGKITSYYEWFGSGEIETGNLASAIYVSDPVFVSIHFCFDRGNIFFLIKLKESVKKYIESDFVFSVSLVKKGEAVTLSNNDKENMDDFSLGEVIEWRIPFSLFNGHEGDEINVKFHAKRGKEIVSVFPSSTSLNIPIPTERDYAKNWTL